MRYFVFFFTTINSSGQLVNMNDHCLIIEDISVSLIGLRKLIFDNYPSWIVDSATTVEHAITLVNDASGFPYTVIILALSLAGHTGMSALLQLKQSSLAAAIPCLVLSSTDDSATMDLCRVLGAHGQISKRMPASELLQALEVIRRGGSYFRAGDSVYSRNDAVIGNRAVQNAVRLTPRQRDIVDLLLAGYSNRQIADTLTLTYGTVKNYMFDLMRLLEVNSRLELAVKVRKSGYIPAGDPLVTANNHKFY